MTRRNSLAARIAVLLAIGFTASCSSDGVSPIRVHQVLVTPADTAVRTGETVQMTAEALDAAGTVLQSRSVTWASSDDAIATVSTSGLVTAHATGQVTITATADDRTGSATVVVEPGPFEPASDVEIAGDRHYASLEIPAGVTVTATADVTILVDGPVTIDGVLEGDCVAVSVVGAGDLALHGVIDNSCATPGSAKPELRIIGEGALTIDGAEMYSSGDIIVANDPAISTAATDIGLSGVSGGTGVAGDFGFDGPWPCDIRNYTVLTGVEPAAAGANGQHGGAGAHGSGFVLACNGDLTFRGNVQVETQAGGAGGDGNHESAIAADATGGKGGDGGILLLRAFGDMTFSHETGGAIPNHFFAGDGGDGGDAEAEALADPTPAQAPGATAVGGEGGAGGTIRLEVQGVLTAVEGSFYAGSGFGGAGGEAIATGADGAHASERIGGAQTGGAASATGGIGGHANGFTWVATGGAVGVDNLVFDDTADGGAGGDASAESGAGGDGDEDDIDGAIGGSVSAVGGNGGDAHSGFGGAGGSVLLSGALGGYGWNGCVDPAPKAGGNGGAGGAASGRNGTGGNGLNPGADGGVFTLDVSNGGDGGDGEGPGARGLAGANGITASNPIVEVGSGSFRNGEPGVDCELAEPDFGIALLVSYLHFEGFSRVCLQVETSPAQPNASFQATVTGPGVTGPGAHSGTLDPYGRTSLANDISSYGSYLWSVTVGSQEAQSPVNVTPSPGTGDC